jgi:hypothetical protein
VFVELDPFLAGGVAVFLDWSELAALVEEGDVVADDVLVEDGDVAAGGLDVEVAEQGCADVDGQAAVDQFGGEDAACLRSRRVRLGSCGD